MALCGYCVGVNVQCGGIDMKPIAIMEILHGSVKLFKPQTPKACYSPLKKSCAVLRCSVEMHFPANYLLENDFPRPEEREKGGWWVGSGSCRSSRGTNLP